MLKLFPDQQEIMNDLRATMREEKSILLQSATGSGKTAMATDMVIGAVQKGKKALFSVPRRDLLIQTSKTFTKYNIPHGFIAAGRDFNPFAQVYIGMVDTMARRIDRLPPVDLAIFDETHFGADALGRVIRKYQEHNAWTIGLSATPWKLSGEGLGKWYKRMVQGKSIRWLIDNKRLSAYDYYYGKPRADFSKIMKKSDREIAEFMKERRVIIGDCVDDYRKRCMGRLHLVRCADIENSQITAEAFRNAGIPAAHVDGETPDAEKAAIFKAFAMRQLLVLTFADLLNFGFDLSQATGMDVCVESISDLKPSKSLAAQMQFWGRALRYKDYPAIINDHVNNYLTHGVPCSDRKWTLADWKELEGGERGVATRQCKVCYYVHTPAPVCPGCGHVYEVNAKEMEYIAGDLEKMDLEAMKAQLAEEEQSIPNDGSYETLERLIKLAKRKGQKNPAAWAANEMAKKMAGGDDLFEAIFSSNLT